MGTTTTMTHGQHESKTKLLDAALRILRANGYAATTIDDVCAAAGLTKGSFFHHFKSKEDLASAAARRFAEMADGLFAQAPYHALPDPLDRLLGYIDFRKSLLHGELPAFTCLLGTMVQEVYETHPILRDACERGISAHAGALEADIAEAMRAHPSAADVNAASLALFTQCVIQGAFILAKAKHGPEVAAACLDHLRRYLQLLFDQPQLKEARACQ